MQMQSSFLNFIRSGAVGDLCLGQSRSDVIAKVGEPQSWLGKPPCFGPIAPKPAEASRWFYYEGAAGVAFDQHDLAVEIAVTPENIRGQRVFCDWPIGPGAMTVTFRNYLLQNRIPFYEELDADESHYILACKYCVAQCSSYANGRLLPVDEQPITMISTTVDDTRLPHYISRRRHRELVEGVL